MLLKYSILDVDYPFLGFGKVNFLDFDWFLNLRHWTERPAQVVYFQIIPHETTKDFDIIYYSDFQGDFWEVVGSEMGSHNPK